MHIELDSQLNHIFARLGYHNARKTMKNHYGRGFGKSKIELIEQLVQLTTGNKTHLDFIRNKGLDCVHLGNRQIELFHIHDDARNKSLTSYIENINIATKNLFAEVYPFPIIDQAVLNKVKKNQVLPIEKGDVSIGDASYQYVVFTTVIEHEVKIDGSPFLNKEGLELVSKSNANFYYVSNEYRQLFHILYWDQTNNSAILSIDRNGLSLRQSRDQLYLIRHHIDQTAIGTLGKPMNVFDAITPLYTDFDGHIIRLGHVTSDSNPVRLSLSRGQKCLKQDKYHDAGELGGHVHAKFAIGKRWSFGMVDDMHSVEVGLAGKAAMLDTSQPLTDFAISKCARLADFNFAIQHVRPHAC